MLPIMDALLRNDAEDEARISLIRQRRNLRDQSDPFSLQDDRFIELFRLDKQLARNLINLVSPHLNERQIQSGITNEIKVLATLRFYATGCYQRSVGEDYHIALSQTSVHRLYKLNSLRC